jgi:transcriptional regulator NrdR family protein
LCERGVTTLDNNVYDQLVDLIVELCKSKDIKAPEAADLFERFRVDVLERLLEGLRGYYVLKNDGRLEKFDKEKLYISIANASDEINQPLNKSDIDNVVNMAINNIVNLNNHKIVTTKSIRKAVVNSLNNMGFQNVSRNFSGYVNIK